MVRTKLIRLLCVSVVFLRYPLQAGPGTTLLKLIMCPFVSASPLIMRLQMLACPIEFLLQVSTIAPFTVFTLVLSVRLTVFLLKQPSIGQLHANEPTVTFFSKPLAWLDVCSYAVYEFGYLPDGGGAAAAEECVVFGAECGDGDYSAAV